VRRRWDFGSAASSHRNKEYGMLIEAGSVKVVGLHGIKYDLAIKTCTKCGALLDYNLAENHTHEKTSGPTIEFRWENDDYADIYCNGVYVAYYNYDEHGRDGLELVAKLAEEIAKVLGGTFESEN
jgi:hypothetical protein